jgi:predicted nucleotidyltransferase
MMLTMMVLIRRVVLVISTNLVAEIVMLIITVTIMTMMVLTCGVVLVIPLANRERIRGRVGTVKLNRRKYQF